MVREYSVKLPLLSLMYSFGLYTYTPTVRVRLSAKGYERGREVEMEEKERRSVMLLFSDVVIVV